MSKVALITGITGQDGSYLAEFLLEKGYEVHGITRRASISNTARIDHLIAKNAITLHDGDLSDSSSLIRIIGLVQPDEIYNLAAQSHVQVSFDVPEYSGDVDAIGVLRILEAVRILGLAKKTKVYQASTSELFGKVEEVPQRETTPFHPYSPYAVAKQYGFWIVKEYREAYGMFAVNGILFNHESERRGENFVTRKITLAAGRIAEGIQDHLEQKQQELEEQKEEILEQQEILQWEHHEKSFRIIEEENLEKTEEIIRDLDMLKKLIEECRQIIKQYEIFSREYDEISSQLEECRREKAEIELALENAQKQVLASIDQWIVEIFELKKNSSEWKPEEELLRKLQERIRVYHSVEDAGVLQEMLRLDYEQQRQTLLEQKTAKENEKKSLMEQLLLQPIRQQDFPIRV